MRYFLIFICLFGIFIATRRASSCHFPMGGPTLTGTGPITSTTRTLPAFDQLDCDIYADVTIKISSETKVDIQGQQNIIDALNTEVTGSTLKVYFNNVNIVSDEPLKITVYAPAYSAIGLNGSANIRCDDGLRGNKLDISLHGAGDITLAQCEYTAISCDIQGSGNVVANGRTETFDVSISGSGDVKCANLEARIAKLSISGSGNIQCGVKDDLNASISGSGDIRYSGRPIVKTSVSGSGEVENIGAGGAENE
jgi:Putative auto-transporter adhesin, head GIN domain